MADELELAASVRAALVGTGNIREVRMLLLRVGKDHQAKALAQSGARPMVMRGRTMEGYVYVDPPALNKQAVQNGSGWRSPMCKPYRRRRTGSLNRERENGNEDAFRTASPAYLAPTFALGFVWHLMLFHGYYEQLAMYR